MAKQNIFVQSFNVGVVDPARLARVDLERMRLAAEDQTNLLCTVSGNMFLRPGLGFLNRTLDDSAGELQEFVFSSNDAALLEFTDQKMRVYVNDELVTRESVSTTVNHGDFSATGAWALTATDGASSTIGSGFLQLKATATGSKATAKQEVTVAAPDRGVEHSLKINVNRGPVTFRCGSTSGGDQYISETELKPGEHHLAFTPTGSSFWIFFQTTAGIRKLVEACQIEDAGVMKVTTPWSSSDLSKLRGAQSADVIFVACDGQQPRRIERRGDHSWSIVKYQVDDGPFTATTTAPVRLKPADTRGNTTLTASDNFFSEDHVGALFYLFHNGQNIEQDIAGDEVYTDPIKVTGVYNETESKSDRTWHYTISGTWSGTLRTYKSVDSVSYGYKQWRKSQTDDTVDITGNVSDVQQADNYDNSIFWYRMGFEDGAYTSGAATVSISYSGGGDYGICRVTDFTDKQTVSVEVLKPFKNTVYTDNWKEGMWSDAQDWPTAVGLAEGRLDWAGVDKVWDSVSDAYESFDETIEGDSGPISRSIAIGGVNEVQWVLPLQRVAYGTNGGVVIAKSSSLDEPLSPTNFTLKSASSIGCGPIAAVKIDGRGVYADAPLKALFELVFTSDAGDYTTAELTRLCASWYQSGIVKIAVSRRPDTRVWAVLENGKCMCMVYEPAQQVVGFIPIETDGDFESVAVLPGTVQDDVYFIVNRTINGTTHRHVEKMARDNQAVPATRARVMDGYVDGTNSPASATITGLTHLRGKQVKVWADGAPINETTVVNGLNVVSPKLFTVDLSGTITLDSAVTDYCVGLPYQGKYKSARLAYAAQGGTAMFMRKRINEIGLLMTDYARSGINVGKNFDEMYPLPAQQDYETPDDIPDLVTDEGSIPLDGEWNKDSRICITADWPANFLGLEFSIDTNG